MDRAAEGLAGRVYDAEQLLQETEGRVRQTLQRVEAEVSQMQRLQADNEDALDERLSDLSLRFDMATAHMRSEVTSASKRVSELWNHAVKGKQHEHSSSKASGRVGIKIYGYTDIRTYGCMDNIGYAELANCQA